MKFRLEAAEPPDDAGNHSQDGGRCPVNRKKNLRFSANKAAEGQNVRYIDTSCPVRNDKGRDKSNSHKTT